MLTTTKLSNAQASPKEIAKDGNRYQMPTVFTVGNAAALIQGHQGWGYQDGFNRWHTIIYQQV